MKYFFNWSVCFKTSFIYWEFLFILKWCKAKNCFKCAGRTEKGQIIPLIFNFFWFAYPGKFASGNWFLYKNFKPLRINLPSSLFLVDFGNSTQTSPVPASYGVKSTEWYGSLL